MATTPAAELCARVHDLMPSVLATHAELVAIPSVAFPGFPSDPVDLMAATTVEAFRAIGVPARLTPIPSGYPAVVADLPAPPGAPTVLMYAHYDVQPAPADQGWHTDPFTPTLRDGRIHGRGAADDKAGIAIHLATLAAFDGRPPVGVRLVIEGEEETDSHLEAYVRDHPDEFAADVMLIADMGNLTVGEPVLTVALRGHVRVVVQVDTLEAPVHSGVFGGAVPDALTALIRLLATLTDESGDCTVQGLVSTPWTGADYSDELVRSGARVLDGVQLVGTGSAASRLWSKPSISVLGIDAPSVAEGGNVLHASARAAIGLRIPAGQEPAAAAEALVTHLRARVPWGARLTTEVEQVAAGFEQPAGGAVFDHMSAALTEAYGREVQVAGSGGSIPLLDLLRTASPAAQFVLFGAEDTERSNIHGPDESVDPTEIERMALAQALLLQRLRAQ